MSKPFDPANHLMKVRGGRSHSDEHRRKISDAVKEYHRERGHLSEYQKSGPEHPNFRGGVKPDYYRRLAFDAYGTDCQRCGSGGDVIVHHVDRNRRNSDVSNLEVLCKSCHQREHRTTIVAWSCPVCDRHMDLLPNEAARRKYCSMSCRNTGRARGIAA